MARGNQPAGGKPVSVLLSEPAKVGGKRKEPGETVTVPSTQAEQLVLAGAGVVLGAEGAAAPSPEPAPQADLLPAAADQPAT